MPVAYRLDLSSELPAAVRAVAAERLDDAITQLRGNADRVTAVHEARKDIKKTRSLLRLVRTGMAADDRRRANGALRHIAASLSGTRDADVLQETLAKLGVEGTFRFATSDPDVPAAIAALERERDAVTGWTLDGVDRRGLAAGAALAYARGRAEYRASLKAATAEGLHEWRKRVKDLWYHARLLEDAWPGYLGALADEAHTLADLLGDDHDLAVLAERIEDLAPRCHRRRAELQDRALALGARLYAEKPKPFGKRIAAYLVG